jgi:hypothetical protein
MKMIMSERQQIDSMSDVPVSYTPEKLEIDLVAHPMVLSKIKEICTQRGLGLEEVKLQFVKLANRGR